MLVVTILLAIQSYWDLRYKEIPIIVTLCGGVLGILYSMQEQRAIEEVLEAFILGAILLIIGRFTKEAIGYGDGWLVCMLGLFYSSEKVWVICITAFFLAAIVSISLIVFFRKRGTYQVPFVPFLLVANLICLIEEGGSIL